MLHPSNHIFEHTPETLKEWCSTHGMKPFRAAQILEWVYVKRIIDPAAMSNLSALDREILGREMTFLSGRLSSTVGSEAWNSRDLKSRPH